MDEAQVKTFLNIHDGTEAETFSNFLASGSLADAVAEYLDAAVDGGSLNGSPEYDAWCKTAAADILAGKYGSLADVQAAADAFVASK